MGPDRYAVPAVGAAAVAATPAAAAPLWRGRGGDGSLSLMAQGVRSHRQLSSAAAAPSASAAVNPLTLGRFNHLAVAVPDLDAGVALYRDVLGGTVSAPQPLPEHGVTVAFVELPNTKIELLHPLGERSPIQGFLDKNPAGGMHHICIEVSDVTAAIAELKAKGVRVLSDEPKIGAHNKPVVFLHPKDCGGVLVELEEE